MADVYAALGPKGPVALKCSHAESQSQDELREEIALLRSFEHPGVVPVLDAGEHDGRVWYTMPLYQRRLGDAPGTLADDMEIQAPSSNDLRPYRLLASTLSWLHAQGIVHRDLKPSNVLLDEDGTPVLADFGISFRVQDTSLRTNLPSAALAGTQAYAAPEQLRGGLVDGRADLYALGRMLPPLPSLAALRGQLLQPDPSKRPAYAARVGAALEALGAGTVPSAWPEVTPRLIAPRLIGRAEVVAPIHTALAATPTTAQTPILLHGPSGSGKTRVTQEAQRIAASAGFTLWTVPCGRESGAHGRTSRSMEVFRPLLRAVAGVLDGRADLRHAIERSRDALAFFEPALGQLSDPHLAPANLRERAIAGCLAALKPWCARQPTLLIVDDIQWVDELSEAALQELARSPLPGLQIVITCRSEHDAAEKWLHDDSVRALTLRTLRDAEIQDILSASLAQSPLPANVTQALIEFASGSPLLATLVLEEARESGLLRFRDGGWQWDDPERLPTTRAENLLASRLDRLEGVGAQLVEAGAVLGRAFPVPTAQTLCGVDEAPLRRAIRSLVSRQVLREEAPGTLAFVHDKLLETSYARLADPQARRLHLAAAKALQPTAPPSVLAHHEERGGDLSAAFPHLVQAARDALQEGRLASARQHVEHAIGLDDGRLLGEHPAVQRAEIGVLHAESVRASGAGETLERTARAALEQVAVHVPERPGPWAMRLMREVGRFFLPLGMRRGNARVDSATANLLHECWWRYFTDPQPSPLPFLGLSFWAGNAATRAGDARLRAITHANLGLIFAMSGWSGGSERAFERAWNFADASNNPMVTMKVGGWHSFALLNQGHWERSMAVCAETRDLAKRYDALEPQVWIGFTETLTYRCCGEMARARELLAQFKVDQREHWARTGLVEGSGGFLSLCADVHLHDGELDEAEAFAHELLETHRADTGETVHVASAHALLGCIAERRGNYAESIEHAEQNYAILGPKSSNHFGSGLSQQLMPDLRLRLLRHGGDLARAKNAAEQATKFGKRFAIVGATGLRCQAGIAAHLGQERRAKKLAQQALAMAESLRTPFEMAKSLELLGRSRDAATLYLEQGARLEHERVTSELP